MPASVNAGDIFVTLRAVTGEFVRGMGIAHNRMYLMEKQSQVLGAAISTGLAVALGVAGRSAIKMSGDLQESMGMIEGLVGIAKNRVDEFRDGILKMSGADTLKGPQELGNALYFITSAGIRGSNALSTLHTTAIAAAGGLGETKDVADTVVSAMNAWAHESLSAEMATSILVNTVKEGKVEAEALVGAFGKVIPVAAGLGVKMQEVGATLAALTRKGMNADEAATGLRRLLLAFAAPAKEAEEALQSIGLSSQFMRDTLAGPNGLLNALTALGIASQGSFEKMEKGIPNIRALTPLLSLLGKGGFEAQEIFRSLAGTLDTDFNKPLEAQRENIHAVAQALNAEFSVSLTRIGDELSRLSIGPLKKATEGLQLFNLALEGGFDSGDGLLGFFTDIGVSLGEIALAVGVAIPLLKGLGTAYSYLAGGVAGAYAIISSFFTSMMAVGAVTNFTAALTAVGSGFVLAVGGLSALITRVLIVPLADAALHLMGIKGSIDDIQGMLIQAFPPSYEKTMGDAAEALLKDNNAWQASLDLAQKVALKKGEILEIWPKISQKTKESAMLLIAYNSAQWDDITGTAKATAAKREKLAAQNALNKSDQERADLERKMRAEADRLLKLEQDRIETAKKLAEADRKRKEELSQITTLLMDMVEQGMNYNDINKDQVASQGAFNVLLAEFIRLGGDTSSVFDAMDRNATESTAAFREASSYMASYALNYLKQLTKINTADADHTGSLSDEAKERREIHNQEIIDDALYAGEIRAIFTDLAEKLNKIQIDSFSDAIRGALDGDQDSFLEAYLNAGKDSAGAFVEGFAEAFMKQDKADFKEMFSGFSKWISDNTQFSGEVIGNVASGIAGAIAAYQSRDKEMTPIERGMLGAQVGSSAGWIGAVIGGVLGFFHGMMSQDSGNHFASLGWVGDNAPLGFSDTDFSSPTQVIGRTPGIHDISVVDQINQGTGAYLFAYNSELQDATARELVESVNEVVRATFSSSLDLIESFGLTDLMSGISLSSFNLGMFEDGGDWQLFVDDMLTNVVPSGVLGQLRDAFVAGFESLGFDQRSIEQLFDEASSYSAEDRLGFFQSIVNGANAINDAIGLFTEEYDMGSLDMLRGSFVDLFNQVDMIQARMYQEMDSAKIAEDAERIASLVVAARQSEIQMLLQIDQLQKQINQTIDQSIESLRLGGMSDAEQLKYFIDDLLLSLSTFGSLTNPEDIAEAASGIHDRIMDMSEMLGDNLNESIGQLLTGGDASISGVASELQALASAMGLTLDPNQSARDFLIALLESLKTQTGTLMQGARDEVTGWADRLEQEAIDTAGILFDLGAAASDLNDAMKTLSATVSGMVTVTDAVRISTRPITQATDFQQINLENATDITINLDPTICVNVAGDAAPLIRMIDARIASNRNNQMAWS